MKRNDPRITAPLLLLSVYALLLLTRLVPTAGIDSLPKLFFSLMILELLVFAFPAFFFCKFKGRDFAASLPLSRPSGKQAWFYISLTLFLLFGGLFLNGLLFTVGIKDSAYAAGGSFILSDISLKPNVLYVILAYAALPAACEEFVFRGILPAIYKPYGVAPAILVPALASAFCFFDLPGFFSYFLTGLVLAFAVHVTGSVFAAMLMRFAVNLASVYLLPPLWNLMIQPLGNRFALLISLFLAILFLIFALKSAESALSRLAQDPARADDCLGFQEKKGAVRVFFSPSFLACALLFLTVSILRLVL